MRFAPGNPVVYDSDSCYGRSIPSNIDYELCGTVSSYRVFLRAPGYGGDPYGNGTICVKLEDVLFHAVMSDDERQNLNLAIHKAAIREVASARRKAKEVRRELIRARSRLSKV